MGNRSHQLLSRDNTGFLLAKAMQRWNEQLSAGFRKNGYPQVRPSYGSILVPLFEEDGLRLGELAKRSRLSKQTMTTMVRLLERDGLVRRVQDANDARATRVVLSPMARTFEPVAGKVLAEIESCARRIGSRQELAAVRNWLRKFAAS